MIEADRPTIASMLRGQGYRTAMVGKWHVGLRYRRSDGSPADGWQDADLSQPLHTTPINHGFDYARFTSRSHGTSGPSPSVRGTSGRGGAGKNAAKRNHANQTVGPGHIHGHVAVGATGNGKQLVAEGPDAYVLNRLGSRHSDHAIGWLQQHVESADTRESPFFLYYPSNSNHSPYTPDDSIGGRAVAGAARTKSGKPMDARHDYVYENDVALGRLLDWLQTTDDPRRQGEKLINNTVVVFTSDNGAEKNSDIATGPFRSNKGSCYEGGHRVPFLISWPAGGIGDGDEATAGDTHHAPIGLQDMYATFAEIAGASLPDIEAGQKGAEDSVSVVKAFHGDPLSGRPPLFFHDHKEADGDPAVAAVRIDSPMVDGETVNGKWKLFFDASLLRSGRATPIELYDLAVDQWETKNLIGEERLRPLIKSLTEMALTHRTAAGHRLVSFAGRDRIEIDFRKGGVFGAAMTGETRIQKRVPGFELNVTVAAAKEAKFNCTEEGLGIGDDGSSVDHGESILVRFDRDVIVESTSIVAGADGVCGGSYRVGDAAPLAVYCVDADIDANDQSGILSDIGMLKAGDALRLDSSPHYGVEAEGSWRLQSLMVRLVRPAPLSPGGRAVSKSRFNNGLLHSPRRRVGL